MSGTRQLVNSNLSTDLVLPLVVVSLRRKEFRNKLRNVKPEPEHIPSSTRELNKSSKSRHSQHARTRRSELAPSSEESSISHHCKTDINLLRKHGSLNCWEKVNGGEERNNTVKPVSSTSKTPTLRPVVGSGKKSSYREIEFRRISNDKYFFLV